MTKLLNIPAGLTLAAIPLAAYAWDQYGAGYLNDYAFKHGDKSQPYPYIAPALSDLVGTGDSQYIGTTLFLFLAALLFVFGVFLL